MQQIETLERVQQIKRMEQEANEKKQLLLESMFSPQFNSGRKSVSSLPVPQLMQKSIMPLPSVISFGPGNVKIDTSEHSTIQGECFHCSEKPATLICTDCEGKHFCQSCFALLHKAPSKKNHRTQSSVVVVASVLCGNCDDNPAVVHCTECAKAFCAYVNYL